MEQQIDFEDLVNTALVFNVAPNDDGDNDYYASIVANCLKTQDRTRLSIGTQIATVTRDDVVYFDLVGSQSVGKTYAKPREWAAMPAMDKLQHWTLKNGDYVLVVKTGDTLPSVSNNPMNEDEFDVIKPDVWEVKRITDNSIIQDEYGNEVIVSITLGA